VTGGQLDLRVRAIVDGSSRRLYDVRPGLVQTVGVAGSALTDVGRWPS
jgi:hypothetical protein